MKRSRRPPIIPRRNRQTLPRPKVNPPKIQTVQYLLEQGTLHDMREAKQRTEARIKYFWQHYSELAYQRKQIEEDLKRVLNESSVSDFEFKQWQRGVKWKYSLHPLSVLGSTKFVGGRFNVGEINPQMIPVFPALYIARDKETAAQELLAQTDPASPELTPAEQALTNPQSVSFLSVSGKVERIFDLRTPKYLSNFIKLLKDFKFSSQLIQMAKAVGEPTPELIKDEKILQEVLLMPQWRDWPVNLDIPANSQIFGQLVYSAGIDGIVYPSKFTGKECLALFPRNFAQTTSFVELDDEAPDQRVPKRIDSTNWKASELTLADFFAAQSGSVH